MRGYGLDSSGSREDAVAGSCEKGNEFWGFKKCTEFHK